MSESRALQGLLLRHRRLPPRQRRQLAELNGAERLKEWVRLHAQYKFAPVALLQVGRNRLREMLANPEYLAYLRQLDSWSQPDERSRVSQS